MALAHPVFLYAKDPIQDPVPRVFHAPMIPDRTQPWHYLRGTAGNEIADFRCDVIPALARGLPSDPTLPVGPVAFLVTERPTEAGLRYDPRPCPIPLLNPVLDTGYPRLGASRPQTRRTGSGVEMPWGKSAPGIGDLIQTVHPGAAIGTFM